MAETVSNHPSKKTTRDYPIFGAKYRAVELKDNSLKGQVYYIVSGHGGPDPGCNIRLNNHFLAEDEYAYDVSLRLARNLIARELQWNLS